MANDLTGSEYTRAFMGPVWAYRPLTYTQTGTRQALLGERDRIAQEADLGMDTDYAWC